MTSTRWPRAKPAPRRQVLTVTPSSLMAVAWQVPRAGRLQSVVYLSADGADWGAEEVPMADGAGAPSVAVSQHFIHVVATGVDDGALRYVRRGLPSGA